MAGGVGLHRRGRLHRELVQTWGQLDVRVQGLVPGDHLARLGGHAAHDADQGRIRTALGFVVGLVLADRLEEQVVLDLVVVAGGAWYFQIRFLVVGWCPR